MCMHLRVDVFNGLVLNHIVLRGSEIAEFLQHQSIQQPMHRTGSKFRFQSGIGLFPKRTKFRMHPISGWDAIRIFVQAQNHRNF